MSRRIGIYSGTYNPVHAGHISFALQSLKDAKLNKVYFLPERFRPNKTDVTHYAHRVAMIRQAIKPHKQLGLIEDNAVSFSVENTLPKLTNRFNGSTLVFLMGSDSLANLKNWPKVDKLLKSSELVIGIREGDQDRVQDWIKELPQKPLDIHLIDSLAPSVSSTKVREALRRQEETEGILPSVRKYSNQNWLYVSLA